jgi:uncharacterized membrane protein YjjP (DUF1212 family)
MERNEVHDFLTRTGTLLHRYGTPSHRLERVMAQIAGSLGVKGVFLYTPTALIVSITDESGESTYLRRVDSGSIDVDKLIRFDEALEELEAKTITVAQASRHLELIASDPPPYSDWLTILACSVCCAAVAVFFRGNPTEILASACIGLFVAILETLHAKLNGEQGLLEPVTGFLAAVSALAVAKFVFPIDDRLVTLAGLIVMIPGLKITVALTELAVGHLSAGVARLAGACVSLLTITVGVGIGWRVAGSWRHLPTPSTWQLPDWLQWLAIVIAPITFSIVFKARWRVWPIITAVSIAGFLASITCGRIWGIEVGAFCGALVVGMGSNLYARIQNRPALVPLTPGIIVLVPGSLGYRSLTAFLDRQTMVGIDFAFNMIIVAVALVGGVLIANALLPPKRIL